jgi:ATP-binding cassette subfamily F protein 3
MSLLNLNNLAFSYCYAAPLFAGVSFEVNPHDKIGLAGPNGAGKTTLLRILAGELAPTEGNVACRSGLRVVYAPQESPNRSTEILFENMFAAAPKLARLRKAVKALESQLDQDPNAAKYAELLGDYQEQGGYRFEAAIERVLDGLGFDARARLLPMSHLSSGQRARAALAKCLLSDVDLLLMDEPTNHLDIAALEWLEDYLLRLDAAYVFVSHDRVFLSRATKRTMVIERGKLTVFEGNYDFFCEQRALKQRHEWERFNASQRRIVAAEQASQRRTKLAQRVQSAPAGIRSGKDFYRRKAAKVARTARLLKERAVGEAEVSKPWQEKRIPPLDFSHVPRSGEIVLRVAGLCRFYDRKPLFRDLALNVVRGDRWAITGPNGSGKTTLLRILTGAETPDAGELWFGSNVKVGYYAQEGENLDPTLTPVEICRQVENNEARARTLLGCLKLSGERILRPIGTMSAGERGKISLARLLLTRANLLLLDEPTNHLEIEAREAVEATLRRFPGTILFVSHDRFLISKLADHLLELQTGVWRHRIQ